ncbi:hypothetical protein JCM33374_g3357 [Metschnikowia sp. JCM 33374]|nr:hypothetical protein JCM33374_g3357 [Metschnikowia sp. JCM 33374]
MAGSVESRQHFIVCGGAGFIGSHMVDFLLEKYPESTITCIDKLSYASRFSTQNLKVAKSLRNFNFKQIDLAGFASEVEEAVQWEIHKFEKVTIFNFAAESSVDRSFLDPLFFTKNNILSTQNILEALRHITEKTPSHGAKFSMVQISTDEVYGEQDTGEMVCEDAQLDPTTPYAATKAACDLIIGAYFKTYKLPVTIIRANNVYGPRQYPEKLIAVTLDHLRYAKAGSGLGLDKLITIHGSGKHKRSYLHVKDFVRAVDVVETNTRAQGQFGETFNIGGNDEWSNVELVEMVCSVYMRMIHSEDILDFSRFYRNGKDRLYNDSRYSIDTKKILKLGWQPEISLKTGIAWLVKEVALQDRHI